MGNFIDLSGQRFGRLTAVRRCQNRNGSTMWDCLCDCGVECSVGAAGLRGGSTGSCGCLQKAICSVVNSTHGMSKTREYKSWSHMKARCYTPTDEKFPVYGGRGIRVCERWRENFEAFFEDMGKCPPGRTIDRINNDGNYEPGNCRWATQETQQRNRSTNRVLEAFGKRQLMVDWCREIRMDQSLMHYHLKKGRSLEQIIQERAA